MSIRTKLTGLLVFSVLCPLLFSVYFWTSLLKSQDDRERPPEEREGYFAFLRSRDDMLETVRARVARSVDRRNRATTKALSRAARNIEYGLAGLVRELTAGRCFGAGAPAQCAKIINQFADAHPDVLGLWVPSAALEWHRDATRERAVAVRTAVAPFATRPGHVVFHPVVVQEVEGVDGRRSTRSRSDGHLLVTTSVSSPRPVIIWSVPSEIPAQPAPSGGRSYVSGVADRDGRFLAAVTLSTPGGEHPLSSFVDELGRPDDPIRRRVADDVRAGKEGSGTTSIANHEVRFVHRPVDGTELTLISLATPEVSLSYQIYAALWTYLGIVLVAVGGAVLAAIVVANGFTRRLRRLTRVTEQIGAGEPNAPLAVRGKDEIARLARSVRSMAAQIGAHVETLETRVEARTRELRLKAAELERADGDLVRLTKMKSEFIATMSHELRTPLNAVNGFSESMLTGRPGPLTARQRDYLERVHAAGKSLLALINDILDLAKIEAERLTLKMGPLDLKGVVDTAVGNLVLRARQKGIAIVPAVDAAIPTMYSDEARLLQILNNLLSNAVKFTDEGEVRLTATRTGPNEVTIAVADTGIGMEAKDLANLFTELFFQTETARSRNHEGTGLGLAITKRLVEALGGAIGVRSEPGHGSTFTVTLPLTAATTEAAAPLAPSPRRRDLRTILHIDDDPDVLHLTQEKLKDCGVRVVMAQNGAEGLRLAGELHPDLILLDVKLPDHDGWQVLHDLKKSSATRDIPVIVVSIADKGALGFELGAVGYVVKPIVWEVFFAELERFGVLPKPEEYILVVDDKHDSVALMRHELEAKGFSVVAAYDGKQALSAIHARRPRLVVLDLMMPVMDGFETLAAIRRDPSLHDLHVIVVTAKDLSDGERATLEGRADILLEKSTVPIDRLANVVEGLLRPEPQPS